jgi:mono/diheme cytochrome c family protein
MATYPPIPVSQRRIPAWATWLTVFAFLVGGVYLVSNLQGPTGPIGPGASPGSPGASPGVDPAQALALMNGVIPQCQSCHGPNLEGSGAFPALTGVAEGPVSENLQQLGEEHPDDWAVLWIEGTDPAVQGLDRMGMPAFAEQLSRVEIEIIVAYLKTL